MCNIDLENIIIQMGDVEALIEMTERFLIEGDVERAERSVIVLKEVFENRYSKLQSVIHS